MEDLYSNLENYNEVAALEKLKSENRELKMEVDNYTNAMDKLQKDFDTLSSEFKKLENNYSSLLKTARSEIERKTQIISNLNIEKDMLVLTALKQGNKSVLHLKKKILNYTKNNKDNNSGVSGNKKNMKNKKDVPNEDGPNNNCDLENERLREHQIPSIDKVDKIIRDNTHKEKIVGKNAQNADSCYHVKSHTKENVQRSNINIAPVHQHENITPTVESKCIDRKNKQNTLPANIECERLTSGEKVNCPTINDLQHYTYRRNKGERKSLLKHDNDRHSSKSSETSSRDERIVGYQEPSKDMYKDRTHKLYSTDNHRSRDKYDTSQRYKRYVPERHKRSREYHEDNTHRSEFSRSRIRESPDRNYHNSYKEHRADHGRYFNEHERYTHSKERYTGKHKNSYEYEEPYTKRQKIDYYGRSKEDLRRQEDEIIENQELTETFEKLQKQYTSCQSPDYTSNEMASEPIKVIMDTAETPLEDPRLTTSKYVLSNDNGSVSLSISKGRNVDLEPIDKTRWELQNVSMPNALVEPPLEEQLIKDLYTNIDEYQPEFSIESDDADIESLVVTNTHLKNTDIVNKPHGVVIDKTNLTNKMTPDVEKRTQVSLTTYKISKIKKCTQETKSNEGVEDRSLEVLHEFGDDIKSDKQKLESNSNKLSLAKIKKHDISNGSNKSDNETCAIFQNSIHVHDSHKMLSTREIVEGDLELSDETCDNTEVQKILNHSVSEEKLNSCHKSNLVCHTNHKDIPILYTVENFQKEHSERPKPSKSETNNRQNNIVEEEKLLQCEKLEEHKHISKKQKIIKKIHRHKHKELDHVDLMEKNFRSKKDKPKEVKSKFNDLFGDSNSLITPNDLGICESQVQSSADLGGVYVSIFEDAQDATDLEQPTNMETPLLAKPQTVDEKITSVENSSKREVESNSKFDEISRVISERTAHNVMASNSETEVGTMHEKLKLENINKETDIVKTIIISSGIQPDEINTESRAESLVNAEELLSEDNEQDNINATHKTQDILIKALATSTPHKQMVHQIALEIDSKLPDATFSSSTILTNADNTVTCVANTNNVPSAPPDEDLPDVRIFVKRKRRVVKTAK